MREKSGKVKKCKAFGGKEKRLVEWEDSQSTLDTTFHGWARKGYCIPWVYCSRWRGDTVEGQGSTDIMQLCEKEIKCSFSFPERVCLGVIDSSCDRSRGKERRNKQAKREEKERSHTPWAHIRSKEEREHLQNGTCRELGLSRCYECAVNRQWVLQLSEVVGTAVHCCLSWRSPEFSIWNFCSYYQDSNRIIVARNQDKTRLGEALF